MIAGRTDIKECIAVFGSLRDYGVLHGIAFSISFQNDLSGKLETEDMKRGHICFYTVRSDRKLEWCHLLIAEKNNILQKNPIFC